MLGNAAADYAWHRSAEWLENPNDTPKRKDLRVFQDLVHERVKHRAESKKGTIESDETILTNSLYDFDMKPR